MISSFKLISGKTLYLHIGTEKTGTTAIQDWLYCNKKNLKKENLYVPYTFGKKNHSLLASIFSDINWNDLSIMNSLPESEKKRNQYFHYLKQKFRDEIARIDQSNVLVSSEFLQSRLRTPSEISKLSKFLYSIFKEIHIILYVRKPILCATSLYSQSIRSGQFHDFPAPHEKYFNNVMDHKSTYNRWNQFFSKIILRLYDKKKLLKQNLFLDFQSAINLSYAKLDAPKDYNNNTSLNSLQLYLHLAYNKQVKNRHLIKTSNIRKIIPNITKNIPTKGLIPSIYTQVSYADFYKKSDDWLHTNFFKEYSTLWSHNDELLTNSSFRHSWEELTPEQGIYLSGLLLDEITRHNYNIKNHRRVLKALLPSSALQRLKQFF